MSVTSKGDQCFTDAAAQRVYHEDAKGQSTVVFSGVTPGGVRAELDESLLVVSDPRGRAAWSFHIQPDESLVEGEPFYHLGVDDDVCAGAAGH